MKKIIIEVEPVAKGRPRTKFVAGQVITYTPTKTLEAQQAVYDIVNSKLHQPFKQHVPLRITITFRRTKSIWLAKKETMPFRKPDLDNFIKLVLDSINKDLIPDDAQITTIIAKKRWTDRDYGYIELEIEEDQP